MMRCDRDQRFDFQGQAKPHNTQKKSLQRQERHVLHHRFWPDQVTATRTVPVAGYAWASRSGGRARVGVKRLQGAAYLLCFLLSSQSSTDVFFGHIYFLVCR